MQLNRKEVIQQLIDHKGYRNYLEIGVFLGTNFFSIKARHKVAVDPQVKYSRFKLLKRSFRYNFSNLTARSVKLTSDAFFEQKAPALYRNNPLDICFVDGMHEYEFALRDVENSLKYLQNEGVIIMHDCNPATKQAGVSFEEWQKAGFPGLWNGDVWKSIVHLRSLRSDINVFVLDCDQGLGVVTFGKPENPLSFTKEQIGRLRYEDFHEHRAEWLNLRHPGYFYEYFGLKVP